MGQLIGTKTVGRNHLMAKFTLETKEPKGMTWIRLQAVPLQSVESKLGRTGESEMAERETGERPPPQLPLGFLFFLSCRSLASLDFLARVTILRDC